MRPRAATSRTRLTPTRRRCSARAAAGRGSACATPAPGCWPRAGCPAPDRRLQRPACRDPASAGFPSRRPPPRSISIRPPPPLRIRLGPAPSLPRRLQPCLSGRLLHLLRLFSPSGSPASSSSVRLRRPPAGPRPHLAAFVSRAQRAPSVAPGSGRAALARPLQQPASPPSGPKHHAGFDSAYPAPSGLERRAGFASARAPAAAGSLPHHPALSARPASPAPDGRVAAPLRSALAATWLRVLGPPSGSRAGSLAAPPPGSRVRLGRLPLFVAAACRCRSGSREKEK
nr:formin-like protein 5 [Aegilops tauschii subsp. strangulata]